MNSDSTISYFYAHSASCAYKQNWHRLDRHLLDVAGLAAARAAKFGVWEWGFAAGALHDLGKYSRAFQKRLEGSGRTVDHSTIGAHVAKERYGLPGQILAYIIAGHHAGLANGLDGTQPRPLAARLSLDAIAALEPIGGWQDEIEARLPAALPLPPPLVNVPADGRGFAAALFARMLFSALVDSDRLDTEAFYLTAAGAASERGQWSSDLAGLQVRLDRYLESLSQKAREAGGDVNAARAEILAAARAKAAEPRGLFSLTVPTGGGKTLASLAFALEHARRHRLDRVIYVIPGGRLASPVAEGRTEAVNGDVRAAHLFQDEENDCATREFVPADMLLLMGKV